MVKDWHLPDRTPTEIEHHRNILQEFWRRCDQGEKILQDGEKIVSLNTRHLKSTSQNTGEYNSSTDSAGQLLSPLRVALRPLSITATYEYTIYHCQNLLPSH